MLKAPKNSLRQVWNSTDAVTCQITGWGCIPKCLFGLCTSRQIPSGLLLLVLFGTVKPLIGQWPSSYDVLIKLQWQGLWIRGSLLNILAQLASVSVECFIKCPDGRTMNWLGLCFNSRNVCLCIHTAYLLYKIIEMKCIQFKRLNIISLIFFTVTLTTAVTD